MAGHLLATAVLQGVLWCLARLLKRPLDLPVVAAGLLLPHLVLAPWFASDRILLPTIVIERVFPGSPRLDSDPRHAGLNDSVLQFVPWEAEVRTAFREDRLPLWSDRIDGGSSPWVNPQAQVLSPVRMLARLVPLEDSLVTVMALTMMVAIEGTWLAACLLGAGRGIALIAGCGFALGGGTMAWSILPNSSTVAWAPWLLGAVLRLVRRPRWRYLVAASIVTAALAVSGHPETAAASGLLAVVCGLALGRQGNRLRGIGAAAVAAVLGLSLAAPMVVPFIHAMSQARRVDEISVRPMPQEKMLWSEPSTWSVGEAPRVLLQIANPHGTGEPFVDSAPARVPWPVTGAVYCGIVAFAGVAVALAQLRRRAIPLIAFAAVGYFLSVKLVPVERLLLSIPGIKIIVFNRVLPIASLCLCLVGSLGLSRLIRQPQQKGPVLAVIVAAVVSIAIAPSAMVVALWILLLTALVVARRQRRVGLAMIAVVVLIDLVPWARGMLPVGHRGLFYPPTATTEQLIRQTSDDGPWRVVSAGMGYYPSSLAMYGLEDVRHHNPLTPQTYANVLAEAFGFHEEREYFSAFRVNDHPLLDFLNVRVASVKGMRYVPPGFRRLRSPGDGARLAKNREALHRFFVVPSAEVVPKDDVIRSVAALVDARRVVLAAEEVGTWRPPERPWMPRAVRVENLTQGDIDLLLPHRGEKLLATSLTIPEGWTATSNGLRLKTLTINGAFLGVVVPPRIGPVRLRFVPPGLWLGLVLCVISIALLTAPGAAKLWRVGHRSRAKS